MVCIRTFNRVVAISYGSDIGQLCRWLLPLDQGQEFESEDLSTAPKQDIGR
jgi:hypothetical protein